LRGAQQSEYQTAQGPANRLAAVSGDSRGRRLHVDQRLLAGGVGVSVAAFDADAIVAKIAPGQFIPVEQVDGPEIQFIGPEGAGQRIDRVRGRGGQQGDGGQQPSIQRRHNGKGRTEDRAWLLTERLQASRRKRAVQRELQAVKITHGGKVRGELRETEMDVPQVAQCKPVVLNQFGRVGHGASQSMDKTK